MIHALKPLAALILLALPARPGGVDARAEGPWEGASTRAGDAALVRWGQ